MIMTLMIMIMMIMIVTMTVLKESYNNVRKISERAWTHEDIIGLTY